MEYVDATVTATEPELDEALARAIRQLIMEATDTAPVTTPAA